MQESIIYHGPRTDIAEQTLLISSLINSQLYPHSAKSVRLIETHISWVLLAGRYAYKIKKAVNLGFLDFTTLEARHFYCQEEIRLNRRLAPQIYLDVLPIAGTAHAPILGGSPAIEYAVRMRRFASANLMDHLLTQGLIHAPHIDNLAARIASFHHGLTPASMNSPYGTATLIHKSALQNFSQLRTLLPDTDSKTTLAALRLATETEYAACEKQFEERRMRGFIRECHGDLHLGNIVLSEDEPIPFDGIEFNSTLRWIDVINDTAFLFMDLLRYQQPSLAYRFLNAYLETTGDYAGIALLRFYCAYRAIVRAKVQASRTALPSISSREKLEAATACHQYLMLAKLCLEKPLPMLIITHGLPGSGKSTFARVAAQRFQAIRISSDVERKRLFGLSPRDDSRLRLGASIYNAGATGRTYNALHTIAEELLRAGYSVIVDAAFLKYNERERFRDLADHIAIPFVIASIHAGEESLRTRIVKRRAHANDASEADISVLEVLNKAQEPLTPDELHYSVEFSNETESGGFAADIMSWDILERKMLRSHS